MILKKLPGRKRVLVEGVKTARIPGVTTGQALHPQPETTYNAIAVDGIQRVHRAGRIKATGWWL